MIRTVAIAHDVIIAGSNDETVPTHDAKMLHDGIAGSELVIIDGADHALATEGFLGA